MTDQMPIGMISEGERDGFVGLTWFLPPEPGLIYAAPQTEAIVKECIKQCEQHFAGAVGTHAGAHNSAIKKCIDSIREHFGIVE